MLNKHLNTVSIHEKLTVDMWLYGSLLTKPSVRTSGQASQLVGPTLTLGTMIFREVPLAALLETGVMIWADLLSVRINIYKLRVCQHRLASAGAGRGEVRAGSLSRSN